MNLINKKTLEVISETKFRSLHQESLFPELITDEMIANTDYLVVTVSEVPQVEPWQTLTLGDAYIKDGKAYADYVVSDIDIERLKEIKIAGVNEWYQRKVLGGFEYGGYLWDCDPIAVSNIANQVLSGVDAENGYWTNYHNVDVVEAADINYLRDMHKQLVSYGNLIHDQQRRMKTDIQSLKTHAEVWNYEYSV